ncbi:uncharacterized protein LOC144655560 isoform X2 [Oculina patagonica]
MINQVFRFLMIFFFVVCEIYGGPFVQREDGNPVDHVGDVDMKRPALNNENLSAFDEIWKTNEAEDLHDLLEGDIKLDMGPENITDTEKSGHKDALRSRKYTWRTKIVPYEISKELVSAGYMANIQAAISEFEKHTCIKWKPREKEKYWVRFIKSKGCWSSVGYRRKSPQFISLGVGCNQKGIICHEMTHALGFYHEQARPDRDKYVAIFWENIQKGKEHNFRKISEEYVDPLDAGYDTSSIMHYGKYAFNKNGRPTIEVIGHPLYPIGQRNGFSKTDIEQLNALYDCSNSATGSWSSWSNFGPCYQENNKCLHDRQRYCSNENRKKCPGANKYGVQKQTKPCPHNCSLPIAGHWGHWSPWTACSVTCGYGTHTRTRTCNDPAPKNGGKDCRGDSEDVGKCLMTVCNLGPFDVSFESEGMHGWKLCQSHNEKKKPNWYFSMGITSSPFTGPSQDHTSGSGRYIFFETSSPAKVGDVACFYSPKIPPASCQRLTFWYHMYGAQIGTLRVLKKVANGSKTTLWERSLQQGTNWLLASIAISSKTPFQIYFQGVRGGGYKGDIGIDDVKLKACS